MPALYYGLEACPVNKSQIRSLEYFLNNTFRKIFAAKSFDVATECVLYFGCAVQETLCRRKSKFLMKTRRVRPPNGGRNEANSWETGSEYSSGETYTAAAMRAVMGN